MSNVTEMTAKVVGIYVGGEPAKALHPEPQATLEAGRGIVGDRYFVGDGTFSKKLKDLPDREVTLIESEEIDRFNADHGTAFEQHEFRRNIATRGIRLNDLVGRTFSVGSATLEGIRTCEPCKHLASLTTAEVQPAMAGRAGLRARIVAGGIVAVGDAIADERAPQ